MATASQAITTSPTALADLEEGQWYRLQAQDCSTVYVAVAPVAMVPTTPAKAFRLEADEYLRVSVNEDEACYIWSDIEAGRIVYESAP